MKRKNIFYSRLCSIKYDMLMCRIVINIETGYFLLSCNKRPPRCLILQHQPQLTQSEGTCPDTDYSFIMKKFFNIFSGNRNNEENTGVNTHTWMVSRCAHLDGQQVHTNQLDGCSSKSSSLHHVYTIQTSSRLPLTWFLSMCKHLDGQQVHTNQHDVC